jgi:hypothetical protein
MDGAKRGVIVENSVETVQNLAVATSFQRPFLGSPVEKSCQGEK